MSDKTPFYLIAHYCNEVTSVSTVLAAGANAIELDIGYDGTNIKVSHRKDGSGGVLIDTYLSGVQEILKNSGAIAKNPNQLCLMIFDCKNPNMPLDTLMSKVNTTLPYSTYKVNFLYSTAKAANVSFFKSVKTLNSYEALAIDEEDSPGKVFEAFQSVGFAGNNIGYGDGITSVLPGPNVFSSVTEGLGIGFFKFVYAWTYARMDSISELVQAGINGVMVSAGYEEGEGKTKIPDAYKLIEGSSTVYFATQNDTPFTDSPLQTAYQLVVKTSSSSGAGTDALLTFTLTGASGSATRQITAAPNRMFETSRTNLVTIQGVELGTLSSLSVMRNDSGNGPGWTLASITVTDQQKGENYSCSFDSDIGTSATKKSLTSASVSSRYILIANTADKGGAGTDAKLTFTVNGANGSVSDTFDTSLAGVCESGDTNSFFMSGADIGTMSSLTVYNDDGGWGPGWDPTTVQVINVTTGVQQTFTFTSSVDGGKTVTVNA